jgi:hypothetical protein
LCACHDIAPQAILSAVALEQPDDLYAFVLERLKDIKANPDAVVRW